MATIASILAMAGGFALAATNLTFANSNTSTGGSSAGTLTLSNTIYAGTVTTGSQTLAVSPGTCTANSAPGHSTTSTGTDTFYMSAITSGTCAGSGVTGGEYYQEFIFPSATCAAAAGCSDTFQFNAKWNGGAGGPTYSTVILVLTVASMGSENVIFWIDLGPGTLNFQGSSVSILVSGS